MVTKQADHIQWKIKATKISSQYIFQAILVGLCTTDKNILMVGKQAWIESQTLNMVMMKMSVEYVSRLATSI